MGTRGPRPKDPERRQRSKAGEAPKVNLQVLPSKCAVPDPVPHWLDETKAAWQAYWTSELGRTANETDLPALLRLFGYRDEHARLTAVTLLEDFEPLVKGSTGQTVMSPVYKALQDLERQILALEDRFGLNVKNRQAIGAAMVDTAKSLDDLNRRVREQRNPEPRPAPLDLATDEG